MEETRLFVSLDCSIPLKWSLSNYRLEIKSNVVKRKLKTAEREVRKNVYEENLKKKKSILIIIIKNKNK